MTILVMTTYNDFIQSYFTYNDFTYYLYISPNMGDINYNDITYNCLYLKMTKYNSK